MNIYKPNDFSNLNLISPNDSLVITREGRTLFNLTVNPAYSFFSVLKQDSTTIELLGNSTVSDKLRANVKISVDAGNDLVAHSDGLYVAHASGGGSGTVTSVGLNVPAGFSVSGEPVTTSGDINITTALNGIVKGTGSGFTAVSQLVNTDISDLAWAKITTFPGASTDYLAGNGTVVVFPTNLVHTTGNETIAGNKTFSGTTVGVTPATNDNSTKFATTAWVIAQGYGSGGGGAWGGITGNLPDQLDLQSALNAKITANSSITAATKTKITYDTKGVVTVGADATTTDIAEGTRLYYTTARFDSRFAQKTTDDLVEGTNNIYFTNARWDTRLASKTTTNLAEGSNLYFTNTRARSALSVTGSLSYDNTTGVFSYSAPSALPPNGAAGGDLTGSYPNPLVNWANGYSVYDSRYVVIGGTGGTGVYDTLAIFSANLGGSTVAAGTTYLGLGGTTFTAASLDSLMVMPASGILKNFFIVAKGAQPGGGSLVLTVMKGTSPGGMADTSLVLTISAGTDASTGTVYSNTSNTVTVNAGDLIVIKRLNNAGTGFSLINISLLYTNQ